jgi:chorismate lyase / 3-hydroxybenzoate synthase
MASSVLRQYYTTQDCRQLLQQPEVLAVITYGGECQSQAPGLISTGLQRASPDENTVEVWEVPGDNVTRGQTEHCYWTQSSAYLMAARWLNIDECQSPEVSFCEAYTKLLQLTRTMGFPHPIRFWNYMENINQGDGDQELYKRFCKGRHMAFCSLRVDASAYPAASAIGHHERGAVVYLLAAKIPGHHVENPLQASAYHYPREYGPSSPSFARATVIQQKRGCQMFISGTASVVGHASHAPDNFSLQLHTTLANIDRLLAGKDGKQNPRPTPTLLKVYLRSDVHYTESKELLRQRYPSAEVIFLVADICRAELQVEIEGVCSA